MLKKKDTWTTRCSVALSQAGAIIWTGAFVTFGSRPRARTTARPLRVEVCASFQAQDNWNNFARCNLGHRKSRCTHSSSWMPRRTSFCRGRAQSRTMGFATGSVLLRVTHTGAAERIAGTSVTITRNWPKEGVHDVGCCGHIARRDKNPVFLVRGSCRARCRWQGRF